MPGSELLLGYFLLKVMLCGAQTDEDLLVTGFNESEEVESRATGSPHAEDKCRGYYDVMGQWDPPFVCSTGNYLYCCGTCGFRFCCAFRSSRLDQTTCKNYDTPPWMMTGRPPAKVDVTLDSAKDKTNLIVYVICGVVAILALIGIFTKLGLEKTHRPHTENVSSALAHVIRHPASQHMDEIGFSQHYENIQTRVTVNSFANNQMNNATHSPTLINQPYPSYGQITSPYEQQTTIKDLNQYTTLKAVEKANDNFFSNQRQMMEMAIKGSLPMDGVDMEPEPSNPYSPPRPTAKKKPNGHKSKSPRSHSTKSLCYSSSAAASPALLRHWESKNKLGTRQSYGPNKLELHTTRYIPPHPYFVTNSKTEVTV